MPDVWMPGAERVAGAHSGGTMTGANGVRRAGWHITWDNLNPRPTFDNVRDYLVRMGYEPHLMWDPETGRIAQFLPADRSAYAFLNKPGGVETNRHGSVCIQIETFFSPGLHGRSVFTDGPMVNLDKLMAWLDSWGIPRIGLDFVRPSRDVGTWLTFDGHVGHCHVPENDHSDPGPIDVGKLFAPTPAAPAPVRRYKVNAVLDDPISGEVQIAELRDDGLVWLRNIRNGSAWYNLGALPANSGKAVSLDGGHRKDGTLDVSVRTDKGVTWVNGAAPGKPFGGWYVPA